MRDKISKVIWGIIWIAIALLIVGKVFDFIDFNIFFDGWWTLLLIIPCTMSIIRYGFGVFSTSGLYIGVILLLERQGVLNHTEITKMIVPGVLIIAGLIILFKNVITVSRKQGLPEGAVIKEYGAVFAGQNVRVEPGVFYGADLNAIFGGLQLDLRNNEFSNVVVIRNAAVFGGIDIFLPDNVRIVKNVFSLFGGIENNKRKNGEGATVYIEGMCLFGGVKIR